MKHCVGTREIRYTSKKTGQLVEGVTIYFTAPGGDHVTGEVTGELYVPRRIYDTCTIYPGEDFRPIYDAGRDGRAFLVSLARE